MRILAVTPVVVTEDELLRRRKRYSLLEPAGVQVVLENLNVRNADLRALNTKHDIHASIQAVESHFRAADPEPYDLFMSDCVLDGGVTSEQERPVMGIMESTVKFLIRRQLRFSAIARNEVITSALHQRIEDDLEANSTALFKGTHNLNLTFDAIAESSTWNARVEEVTRALQVDVVVNGCSAVEVDSHEESPRIVDPLQTALQPENLRRFVS